MFEENPEVAKGEVLLLADHLKKYFPAQSGTLIQRKVARVYAVENVNSNYSRRQLRAVRAHESSGGQRQRIRGRIVALKNKLMIAYEPGSVLDVSIRQCIPIPRPC